MYLHLPRDSLLHQSAGRNNIPSAHETVRGPSAESIPAATLPAAKHFKTNTHKYAGPAQPLQKEKKKNPTAAFQHQLLLPGAKAPAVPHTAAGSVTLWSSSVSIPTSSCTGAERLSRAAALAWQCRQSRRCHPGATGPTQPQYLQRIASCFWGTPPGWPPAAQLPGKTGAV